MTVAHLPYLSPMSFMVYTTVKHHHRSVFGCRLGANLKQVGTSLDESGRTSWL